MKPFGLELGWPRAREVPFGQRSAAGEEFHRGRFAAVQQWYPSPEMACCVSGSGVI